MITHRSNNIRLIDRPVTELEFFVFQSHIPVKFKNSKRPNIEKFKTQTQRIPAQVSINDSEVERMGTAEESSYNRIGYLAEGYYVYLLGELVYCV